MTNKDARIVAVLRERYPEIYEEILDEISTTDELEEEPMTSTTSYGTCQCHADIHAFSDDCIGWRDDTTTTLEHS